MNRSLSTVTRGRRSDKVETGPFPGLLLIAQMREAEARIPLTLLLNPFLDVEWLYQYT